MLRAVVYALLTGALALAAVLAASQSPFIASRFEYLRLSKYRGVVFEWPYPMLLSEGRNYLLVGEGKHGASQVVNGFGGRNVIIDGTLIENGQDRMLEIVTGSVQAGESSSLKQPAVSIGSFTFSGEIVDTKCYFGVMNPGKGKVHRDCAARCISGGVPPGFLVRDANGASRVLLLAGTDGRPLGRTILNYVAEPLTLRGELLRLGQTWIFEIEPAAFQRE
jgi:hypothetical protein